MYEEGLPVSWLLFVGGLFEFRVSVLDGFLLTFADRCGTLQCLLRIVGFGCLLGVVDRLLSRPESDRRCLEPEGLAAV